MSYPARAEGLVNINNVLGEVIFNESLFYLFKFGGEDCFRGGYEMPFFLPILPPVKFFSFVNSLPTCSSFFSLNKCIWLFIVFVISNIHSPENSSNWGPKVLGKNMAPFWIHSIHMSIYSYGNLNGSLMVGWVLWHINPCWSFNAKSYLYIYQIYMIWFGFMAYQLL